MASTYNSSYLSTSNWYRTSVQLGGGLTFGVLLPFAIALLINPRLFGQLVFTQSFIGALIAVVGGYYLFRSLVAYPGIRASYYILPVYSSAFAVVFVLFLLLRLGYSRPLLIAAYIICIVWYYVVHFTLQRQPTMRIGIVPFGDVEPLLQISSVSWTKLDAPDPRPKVYTAIVADFRADMPDVWEEFLADVALRGTPVLHVKQLRESLTGRVEIEHLSENAHGTLVPHAAYRNAKMMVDFAVSAVAIVVLAPALLIVGLLIKADSPGPMFFRQQRIGYRGMPFRVWKFRTMSHRPAATDAINGDDVRSAAMTADNDARITRIGRTLRRTRIDELPQLLNVLACQMSLIGPRPEAGILSKWYEKEIPFYRYRHIVRPGITGWAQVNQGHVAEVADVHSKLYYDFYYISNYSLWIDLLIVIRTVRTVVTGFGSK